MLAWVACWTSSSARLWAALKQRAGLQVRAKTFVAVGHETANKGEHGKNLRRDTMDANLLSNMELGIHADAAPGRQTSDVVWLCRCVSITMVLCPADCCWAKLPLGHPC